MSTRRGADRIRDERGAVIVLVTVALVVLLGMTGLALDSGRGYLTKAELARAVDAAALGAARALRSGQSEARDRAFDIAAVNGLVHGQGGARLTVAFGQNSFGEQTVRIVGQRRIPTLLMGVLGIDSMTVRSLATAAVPPVDLVLVLDQSGSLEENHAWDDLQDASREFVEYFDDQMDKLGLTSFQLRGTERVFLKHNFSVDVDREIQQMNSAGDTNPGEGLRLALVQLTSGAVRTRSAKVVVFFTDGRPTAFRGQIAGRDRAMAVRTTGNRVRGYWNNPGQLPKDQTAHPRWDHCDWVPVCFGWTEDEVREQGRLNGLAQANAIRREGIYIYGITLGNPDADHPLERPDHDYVRQIANVNGITDPDQPQGKAYFAPSENELRAIFNQVAQDLLVRLAQ